MDTTRAIQIGVASADIVIDTVFHYLPYVAISILIGIFAGKYVYKILNNKKR